MIAWLKRHLPRGLYGRVALIVLLPVLGLQLIVSVVFIQRHFEGVTRQMTTNVTRELRYVIDELAALPVSDRPDRTAQLSDAFNLSIEYTGDAVTPARAFYDFPGRTVARLLHEQIPDIQAVDLCGIEDACNQRNVRLGLLIGDQPAVLTFGRERVSASNPHQLLVIMIVLGGVLTLISFLYLRNQLKPIARLSHAAQAYGRGQILPYKIRGSTEVRAAGAAFLDMRARIERQSDARRLMLSGISHDLRSPLTRMRLALSMSDSSDAPELLRDVDDMQTLVDTFLDFARDEASETAQPSDIPQILRDAVQDATRGGGTVTLAAMDQIALMRLRPIALRRAVDNLIGNGLRYGNAVWVSVEQTEKTVQIVVDDDGPGIPKNQRDDALRPFLRLDPARNQDSGTGVGLGLAIVADVARSHGGRLSLEDAPQGGLRAVLILPK